jgi:hypothetical protein
LIGGRATFFAVVLLCRNILRRSAGNNFAFIAADGLIGDNPIGAEVDDTLLDRWTLPLPRPTGDDTRHDKGRFQNMTSCLCDLEAGESACHGDPGFRQSLPL